MTNITHNKDRAARLAEYRRIYPLLEAENKTARDRRVATLAAVTYGTVRQWNMTSPYRVPSWEKIELLRAALK